MSEKRITSKCKECIHFSRGGRCMKREFYPSALFILAWGCDDYKEKYVDLLKEVNDDEGRNKETN